MKRPSPSFSVDHMPLKTVRIGGMLCTAVFLSVVFFLAWFLPPTDVSNNGRHQNQHKQQQQRHLPFLRPRQQQQSEEVHGQPSSSSSFPPHRVAILLPYVGKSPSDIPPYLNLFCRGAAAAADVADFFFIHNGVLQQWFDAQHEYYQRREPERYLEQSSASPTEAFPTAFPCTNVFSVNLETTAAFAERILRVLERPETSAEDPWALNRDTIIKVLSAQLHLHPYTLVEYKPAYGHIFQDLLVAPSSLDGSTSRAEHEQDDEEASGIRNKYSHWAYSDLDLLFGDLGRHIEEEEWTKYDIVTYGFGDQQRLYVKGQFTMHKNTPKMRHQLWKSCDYLTRLDERLANLIQHREKGNKKSKAVYQMESAEGCYSVALLERKDLKIKFAVKAWTDISQADSIYTHGLYAMAGHHGTTTTTTKKTNGQAINGNHESRKLVLTKALEVYDPDTSDGEEHAGLDLLRLSTDWFLQDPVYQDRTLELQIPNGAMEPLEHPSKRDNDTKKKKSTNCMFWVQKRYQSHLCLTTPVTSMENVYWVDGHLYKQAFKPRPLPSGVSTAPFFHFQEWKRKLRYNQVAALPELASFVMLPTGVLPLNDDHDGTFVTRTTSAESKKSTGLPSSPLGLRLADWRTTLEGESELRKSLPLPYYCLKGEPDHWAFKMQCDTIVSWRDTKEVEFVKTAPGWTTLSIKDDVCLVLTAQVSLTAKQPNENIVPAILQPDDLHRLQSALFLLVQNLKQWENEPSVVLFHVTSVYKSELLLRVIKYHFEKLALHPSFWDLCLFALVTTPVEEATELPISRPALLNMAIDAVPTRWYVSGLVVERGFVLSPDTVDIAQHKVASHQQLPPGHVFVIPTFAFPESEEPWTVRQIVETKSKHKIFGPSDFDPCEDNEANEESEWIIHSTQLWWTQTERLVDRIGTVPGLPNELTKLEEDLLDFLSFSEEDLKGRSWSTSPLLLTDNRGPDSKASSGLSMRTHQLVRHTEEFAGHPSSSTGCLEMLRLAQLIAWGYRWNVLEGAFVASTVTTRSYAAEVHDQCSTEADIETDHTTSRCVLVAPAKRDVVAQSLPSRIWDEERQRPIQSRILWSDRKAWIPKQGGE